MSTYETLEFIQAGRATRRFHGISMHDAQRIDSHLYGVAVLTQVIAPPQSDGLRAARLMGAALVDGDLAEHITGDLPAPTKRRYPAFRQELKDYEAELMAEVGIIPPSLDERDMRVLKLADAAEGCLHCIEERKMGNQHIGDRAFYAFWSYLETEQQLLSHPKYREEGEELIQTYIVREWMKANGGQW